MASPARGQELYGRACRGEKLSDEERAELESWYAEMDAEEAKILKITDDSPTVKELRALLDREIGQLRQTVEDIQGIHAANESLRQEIADLKRRLAEKQPQMIP